MAKTRQSTRTRASASEMNDATGASEIADAMTADAPEATQDQLKIIRAKVSELRDLEFEKASIEERLLEISERRRALTDKELVDVMDDAGVPGITIEARGNLPRFEVEVGKYYHANIASDWEPERRAAAFAWIEKHHAGMLRQTFVVSFGKNSKKEQAALEKFLRERKMAFSSEYGVPWNTLTAFVKEQIEEFNRTPPLALLGATVGRVAKIKKEKK